MSDHITPHLDSSALKLRAGGFRLTPQRLTILRILQESKRHLTPIEVFQLASQSIPGLTEPTVYRTLTFLVEQGLAMAAHVGNGQMIYEFAEHSHHHLVCRACGGMHEVEHDALAPLYEEFQARTGYRIDSVHVTFFGLCPGCQKAGSSHDK